MISFSTVTIQVCLKNLRELSFEFKMIHLGLMLYYLGLEVKQMEDRQHIPFSNRLCKRSFGKFKMIDCNPVNTPMETVVKLSNFGDEENENHTLFKSFVGSLRYLTCTEPDILYAVVILSHLMESPTYTPI